MKETDWHDIILDLEDAFYPLSNIENRYDSTDAKYSELVSVIRRLKELHKDITKDRL